ncbi:site-specific DNA-methyltransferase [Algibacter pectinivorans]|uniref:site-specific DNA-methyltransferase (adenine-specific) n=1 Tax=Algibacter pectinivorans TaxID=870482 RepID=A0A1I1R1L1_9FLAO|nr:site-specific DNA-methyltransferase [Algibacter pectinivorans]SFD28209.1 adenine-specific DNA-methyltransferase [Algibacter pectinivorans]
MNKKDILNKIKSLEGLNQDERAYLVNLVNTKKKYGLVWEDKPEDVEEQLRTKLPVLQEVKERAIINDAVTLSAVEGSHNNNDITSSTSSRAESRGETPNHILIEGDNLHALTALTFTHENKIDLIYIDPPYNTGNKADDGTTDFKYNDDYVDSDDEYRHSKWLSFMSKRLTIARQLLADDGFLCVSIDDNEIAQLKILLDELFNQKTKVVAVKMSEASGLKMGATNRIKNIPKYKEYLVFAKPSGIRDLDIESVKKDEWDNEYNIYIDNFEKKDRDFIDAHMSNPSQKIIEDIDKILDRIELTSVNQKIKDLKIPKKHIDEWKFTNSWRIVRTAASTSVKRLADDKRNDISQNYFSVISKRDKIVYIVKGDYSSESKSPRVQFLFADTNLMVHPGDFWSDIRTTGLEAEGGVEFKNGKKPLKLLNRILNSHFNKNTTILDFFAGSGSTLHSALELNNKDGFNRNVILVTNNENDICENTTYQRCLNVIKGFGSFEGYTNNNLRYYKTAFVEREPSLQNKRQLTQLATELLCIKEDCYTEVKHQLSISPKQAQIFTNNNGKYLVAIYHSRNQLQVQEQLISWVESLTNTTEKVRLYAFSPEKEVLAEEFYEVAEKVEVVPLPEAIYNAYLSTIKALKLDKKQVYNNNTAEA